MSGHIREELLALYLRGDLPESDHRVVARHADECRECQEVLADLSLSYELLIDCFEDPERRELAAVRSAVMRNIGTRRAGYRRWMWGIAATAALLALVVALAWHGDREELPAMALLPRPGPPATVILPPAPVEPPVVHVARAPRKRAEPGMRVATLVTEAGRPAYLKMNTSDPNVVILWQLQENEKVATP